MMKKQTLDQILQQSSIANHSDNEFYSDVALKILLRTMTPVTVPASFEQSVLNKVALLEPTKLYKSFIAGATFYSLISLVLISFSTLLNSEIASFRVSNAIEMLPQEIQQQKLETKSTHSLSNSNEQRSNPEESPLTKKKNVKRKYTNKTAQTPIPPPPKGIE
jgi:hypothetical protein